MDRPVKEPETQRSELKKP